MIAYRDFHEKAARPGFFGIGKDDTVVTFDGAVEEANAWIAAEEVRVLTVETVWTQELNPPRLRVWYEARDGGPKKTPVPELL